MSGIGRFTALVDACKLAGARKRNSLLTLAEGGVFAGRIVLDETEAARKIGGRLRRPDKTAKVFCSTRMRLA